VVAPSAGLRQAEAVCTGGRRSRPRADGNRWKGL